MDPDGNTASFVIEVTPPPGIMVVANFSATPTADIALLTVTFPDTSQGNATSWIWHFNDERDENAPAKNPVHTYVPCTNSLFVRGSPAKNYFTSIDTLQQQKLTKMSGTTLAGGPTQDEIMAVSLFKLGLRSTDTLLEIGCGTGKVSIAAARTAEKVFSLDKRPEAIAIARDAAEKAGVRNVAFSCSDALDFLASDQIFDCAFVGGSQHLVQVLPLLAKKVKRTIVVNAVLLSTLAQAVATMQQLGIFCEVVQVQVARSHEIAGSIMFRPIDPVYVIVGKGSAC